MDGNERLTALDIIEQCLELLSKDIVGLEKVFAFDGIFVVPHGMEDSSRPGISHGRDLCSYRNSVLTLDVGCHGLSDPQLQAEVTLDELWSRFRSQLYQ